MIGIIADLTLSIGWWTVKKVAGGFYYIIYGNDKNKNNEKISKEDLSLIMDEIKSLKTEVHELKEENIILVSKLNEF